MPLLWVDQSNLRSFFFSAILSFFLLELAFRSEWLSACTGISAQILSFLKANGPSKDILQAKLELSQSMSGESYRGMLKTLESSKAFLLFCFDVREPRFSCFSLLVKHIT